MASGAYIIFSCSSRELQARAGFDGWVQLLRDEFDTEDQAWPQERLRLAGVAKRKMRRLESGGVELDMLQLVTSSHLLLDPPAEDREEERIWCIEFFRGKMYDFVVRRPMPRALASPHARSSSASLRARVFRQRVRRTRPRRAAVVRCARCQADDRELVQRLKRFQEELLYSARQAAPKSPLHVRADGSSPVRADGSSPVRFADGAAPSARPSGESASPDPAHRPAEMWAAPTVSDAHEDCDAVLGGGGQRKPMSAASLAAALELTDLESAQQRFGGGAFLPILPLGSDQDSIDRGLTHHTLPDSTLRASISC
jgi:hypothetical protein